MNEADHRPRSARRRVLKSGTISFDLGTSIDCVVRNVSETGALLEIESPVGIPNKFLLVIIKEKIARNCSVIWRSARQIGVRFDRETALKSQKPSVFAKKCAPDEGW